MIGIKEVWATGDNLIVVLIEKMTRVEQSYKILTDMIQGLADRLEQLEKNITTKNTEE